MNLLDIDITGYDTLLLDRDGVINRLRPNDQALAHLWGEYGLSSGSHQQPDDQRGWSDRDTGGSIDKHRAGITGNKSGKRPVSWAASPLRFLLNGRLLIKTQRNDLQNLSNFGILAPSYSDPKGILEKRRSAL